MLEAAKPQLTKEAKASADALITRLKALHPKDAFLPYDQVAADVHKDLFQNSNPRCIDFETFGNHVACLLNVASQASIMSSSVARNK